MGKSDKKIKPDSINKLRMRYDAFLEEDRRRKERNEDILAKLDKMRHTVTSSKAINHREPMNSFGIIPANYIRRYNDPLIKFEDHQNETFLLNEISKKYILIPKLRTAVMDNLYSVKTIKQDHNDDTDWKSKYVILDKLKQSEKEEAANLCVFRDHKVTSNDNDILLTEPPNHQQGGAPSEVLIKRMNLNKNTGDSVSSLQSQLQNSKSILKNGPINYEKLNKNEIPHETKASKADLKLSRDLLYQPTHDNTETMSKNLTSVASPTVDNVKDSYQNIAERPFGTSGDTESKYETEATEKNIHEDIRHVEMIDQCEVNERANQQAESGIIEEANYPIDIINVQDFTPKDGVTLVDGVNINPEVGLAEQAHFASNHKQPPEIAPVLKQDQPYVGASQQSTPGTVAVAEQDQTDVATNHQYTPEMEMGTEQNQQYVTPTYQYAPETRGSVQNQQYISPTHQYAPDPGQAEYNQQYIAPTQQYAPDPVQADHNEHYVAPTHQYASEPGETEHNQQYVASNHQYAPETGEAEQNQHYVASNHHYAPEIGEAEQNLQYVAPTHQYASDTVTEPNQSYVAPSQHLSETVAVAGQGDDVPFAETLNIISGQEIPHEVNYDPTTEEPSTDTINFDQSEANTINFDQLQIQAFETEQNEMFYSGQPNYDEYNAGYNAKSYDQTDYYQGEQQEGTYPVEINDHEEASLRYDPNYAQQYQQYANTDQKDNLGADQSQLQPELVEPMELIQVPQNEELKDITKQIEHQLDYEAGYVEEQQAAAPGADGETDEKQLNEKNQRDLKPDGN